MNKKIKLNTKWINQNAYSIIEKLEQESIEVYKFLKKEYEKTDIKQNYLFQFVFRNFYRLDNAGLTPEFKKEYFNILEKNKKNEPDIKKILLELSKFRNRKGQITLQFSFTTKLLNMIDDNMPIYDSQVAKIFGFSRPYNSDFSVKMEKYLNQYKILTEVYANILNQNLLSETITLFDQKFNNNNLSTVKKIDFILWSAGKLVNKKKRIKKEKLGDNGMHTLEELDEMDKMLKKYQRDH